MLETAKERPHYMPLFVAPQPIEVDDDRGADADDDDAGDSGDSSD